MKLMKIECWKLNIFRKTNSKKWISFGFKNSKVQKFKNKYLNFFTKKLSVSLIEKTDSWYIYHLGRYLNGYVIVKYILHILLCK